MAAPVTEQEHETQDTEPTGSWRSKRPWLIGGGVLGLLVVAVLAFGVFGVQSLFIDDQVDEEAFEFESGAVAPDVGAPSDPAATTEADPAPTTEARAAEVGPEASDAPEPGPPEAEAEAAPAPEQNPPPSETAPPASTEPAVSLVARGGFSPEDHAGRGTVNLYTDGNQSVVRFEDDFATENGPDLYAVVYVGGERVELGQLKGNQGSQNYELPADIAPESVNAVSVWCKRFDSTFTTATVA